jgi:hypothetical protein
MADLDELFYSKDEFGFKGQDQWYDNQIKALWGLDVFGVPFAREKGSDLPSEEYPLDDHRLEDSTGSQRRLSRNSSPEGLPGGQYQRGR